MGWVGYVACMGEQCARSPVAKLKGRDLLENLGVDGNKILKIQVKNRFEEGGLNRCA
jgi:hypothetical protein